MPDPRRLFDSQDMQGAILYTKRIAGDTADAYPLLSDTNGALLISGNISVSASGTESTINNAVGNPVNVSLVSTVVTIQSAGLNVTPTTTASTITNAVGNPVNVSLTSTIVTAQLSSVSSVVTVHISPTASVVTVKSSVAGFNVNIATATLGTVVTSMSSTIVTAQISATSSVVTAHLSPTTTRVSVTMITGVNGVSAGVGASDSGTQRIVLANDMGRTLTGATGSISATWTSIFTPSNKCKVYAFSFTTTSASEVTVIVADGAFTTAKEKWRATLMAPAGASAGANLAVAPPAYIFSSRSTSAITISLSTAVLVHYSLSFFDEA